MKKILLKFKKYYLKIPKVIRRLFGPIEYIYVTWAFVRIKTWLLNGKEVESNEELRIIFLGSEMNLAYLKEIAYDNFCQENFLGKIWFWQKDKVIEKNRNEHTISVIETKETSCKSDINNENYYIPSFIGGEINFISNFTKPSSSLKSDWGKIKKINYSFEVDDDLKQFDNFYYNMYQPFVINKYGVGAIRYAYETLKSELGNCDLILLKKDQEYVAGGLLIYKKNCARFWVLGIKNADYEYVKEGAISALYYYLAKHVQKKGYQKIQLGFSRSFLKDGVLQYKNKWQLELMERHTDGFLVRPLGKSKGVRSFFINNPFVSYQKGEYIGMFFIDNHQSINKEDYLELRKKYYINGLAKLNVYQFKTSENGVEKINIE